MKKAYKKPEVELIDLSLKTAIMNNADTDIDQDTDTSIGDEDDWEWD